MYNKVDNVTEEQLEIIKNLYLNEKLSAKNIGKQFNFSERTALAILKRLGITRAPGTN
jgi:DNA-binding transcriptional regulator LsrR (DeoR family)